MLYLLIHFDLGGGGQISVSRKIPSIFHKLQQIYVVVQEIILYVLYIFTWSVWYVQLDLLF